MSLEVSTPSSPATARSPRRPISYAR